MAATFLRGGGDTTKAHRKVGSEEYHWQCREKDVNTFGSVKTTHIPPQRGEGSNIILFSSRVGGQEDSSAWQRVTLTGLGGGEHWHHIG